MRLLSVFLLSLALVSAAEAAGTRKTKARPSASKIASSRQYKSLPQALFHGAANAMLKDRELRSWFSDREGGSSKLNVMKSLRIADVDRRGTKYYAELSTKARGQDGEPQITANVVVRKLSGGSFTTLSSKVVHVNDIWE